jgi:hypothetical protein
LLLAVGGIMRGIGEGLGSGLIQIAHRDRRRVAEYLGVGLGDGIGDLAADGDRLSHRNFLSGYGTIGWPPTGPKTLLKSRDLIATVQDVLSRHARAGSVERKKGGDAHRGGGLRRHGWEWQHVNLRDELQR